MRVRLQLAVDIAMASIPEDADPDQAELILHDYLLDICSLTNDADLLSQTAFGALVDKAAHADGYAAVCHVPDTEVLQH